MCISSDKYLDRDLKIDLGDLKYSKTFEEEVDELRKINLVISHLENLGVKVKTEYGYYRSSYDILKDLGEYLDKNGK